MGYTEPEPTLVKKLKSALKDREQKYQYEYGKHPHSYQTLVLKREINEIERLIKALS